MLSELAKAAAKNIADQFGVISLIFPAVQDPASLLPDSEISAPNKIVAVVDQIPAGFDEGIRQAILTRLTKLQQDTFQIINDSKGPFDQKLAAQQIADLPEFYWVSVAFADDNAYSQARDQAEALLAARKNTRNFLQAKGDYIPKSSLDGARESVIPETAYPRGNDDPARKRKGKQLYHHYHARQGERLSGVDLLKRLGGQQLAPKFKSTSHMAALPLLERISGSTAGDDQKMLNEIKKMLLEYELEVDEPDGALLYDSRLAEIIPTGDEQKEISQKLVVIVKKYAGEWYSKLSPYYALLAADGDNMGKTIDAQKDPLTHQKLSQALSRFAQAVPAIVSKHKGVGVYAGGDDILAYLPLHTVLDCAKELEEKFKEAMKQFTSSGEEGIDISPTLSTGIVVAHHLTPLSDTLDLARKAEREAKKVAGKNALAITVSKRGGVDRTISGKWGKMNMRLEDLVNLTRQNEISAGIAYELHELHRELSGTSVPLSGIVDEAIRIIKRKRESGGAKAVGEKVIRQFKHWLEVDGISLPEVAQEMVVAKMFAEAADLVDGTLPTVQEVQP
jgi:CRISPR-associated protein Cmr2